MTVGFLRGQAAIALSLAIPMIVGAACIGADARALYISSARLQCAADAAVRSGAVYLPENPVLAQRVARRTALINGIRESEIVYTRSATDGRSLTMIVRRNMPYHFARLLGLSQSLVTVKAVALPNASYLAPGMLPISDRDNIPVAPRRHVKRSDPDSLKEKFHI
jgi:hypothetical protein